MPFPTAVAINQLSQAGCCRWQEAVFRVLYRILLSLVSHLQPQDDRGTREKEIMRLNPTFVVPFAAECFN